MTQARLVHIYRFLNMSARKETFTLKNFASSIYDKTSI